MSDTLQEGEDQLPLVSKNYSERECSEPDCPCHEWVKRDAVNCPRCGRTMQSDFDPDVGMWRECAECDYREAVSSASAHQPAARGGGDEWRVAQRFDGVVLLVRAESDNRETPLLTLSKSDDDYVMANRIVVEHNQHHSLVAERERLRRMLAAVINAKYNNGPPLTEEQVSEIARWWQSEL